MDVTALTPGTDRVCVMEAEYIDTLCSVFCNIFCSVLYHFWFKLDNLNASVSDMAQLNHKANNSDFVCIKVDMCFIQNMECFNSAQKHGS